MNQTLPGIQDLGETFRINESENYSGNYAWNYFLRNIDHEPLVSTPRKSKEERVKKQIQNHISDGYEIPHFPNGDNGAHVVYRSQLDSLINLYGFSTVILNSNDYKRALDHGLMAYYVARWSTTEHGTKEQRIAPKMVSNYIRGHLGELAVKKFLEDPPGDISFGIRKVNIRNLMDRRQKRESLSERVIARDIESVTNENGEVIEGDDLNPVSIKSSRFKSCWLAVPDSQLDESNPMIEEVADFYIFVRVDLPDDHLFRHFKELADRVKTTGEAGEVESIPLDLPNIDKIRAMVTGFATESDLREYNFPFHSENSNPTKDYPVKDSRSEYMMISGSLRGRRRAVDPGENQPQKISMSRVRSEWESFAESIQ